VPYKGAVPAAIDLIGGHVQVMLTGLTFPLPHVKSGKLRALAMTDPQRSALLPDVPTVKETGVNYVFEQWLGLFAPARTPPEIVSRLNAEMVKLLNSPDVRDLLLKQALEPQGGPPENVTRVLREDMPKMNKIIKQLGIKPES
jgi:tripartite-type tricarboxylate transporter receptor subunit TctC